MTTTAVEGKREQKKAAVNDRQRINALMDLPNAGEIIHRTRVPVLDNPPNPPSQFSNGTKLEYPETTHDFWQSVDSYVLRIVFLREAWVRVTLRTHRESNSNLGGQNDPTTLPPKPLRTNGDTHLSSYKISCFAFPFISLYIVYKQRI